MNENVPLYSQLAAIAEALAEKNLNTNNYTITIPVMTAEALKKINENFFYMSEENKGKTPTLCDIINVNILGVHFQYNLVNTNND